MAKPRRTRAGVSLKCLEVSLLGHLIISLSGNLEALQPWLVPRTRTEEHLAATARRACAHLAQTLPCHRVTFGVRQPIRSLTGALTDLIGDLLP